MIHTQILPQEARRSAPPVSGPAGPTPPQSHTGGRPGWPERRRQRFTRLVSLFEPGEIEAAVDALIAYLDSRAGDPDLEPEQDRCYDGDNHMIAGPVYQRDHWERDVRYGDQIGDDDDAEHGSRRSRVPVYGVDQSRPKQSGVGSGREPADHPSYHPPVVSA